MTYAIKEVSSNDYEMLRGYFAMRSPVVCENVITDTYLWKNYYHTQYFLTENGLVWIYRPDYEIFTTTPLCALSDVRYNFQEAQKYFNQVLHQKLVMYLVDEATVNALALDEEQYEVIEERMYFDYVYDADKLRRLPGKAYHKKKNHVNGFLREYGDRYECRMLSCQDREEVLAFLERWHAARNIEDPYHRDDYECAGIEYVLGKCDKIKYKMFGVFVDGKLEAFSMGTYDEQTKTAFIHVEKANPEIRGLYAFINQQFLCEGFPEAELVNREDDMGLEGLRKAKLSYQPLELVKKFTIREK